MMKRILYIMLSMVLLCSTAFAAETEGNLYQEWNRYAEANLWGDGYKTTLDYEAMASELQLINRRGGSIEDGLFLGEVASAYCNSAETPAEWIEAIANNIASYCEPGSVLCYLAEQNIDEWNTRFLSYEINTWTDGNITIQDEIYKLRVSIDSEREEYEIMVILVGDIWEDFAESVLVSSNSNKGYDSKANGTNQSNNVDVPPLYVVNCKEWVSVWSEPTNTSTRLARVKLGGCIYDWIPYNDEFIMVDLGGDVGFMSWNYLSFNP